VDEVPVVQGVEAADGKDDLQGTQKP
jgi:hypothetical protein